MGDRTFKYDPEAAKGRTFQVPEAPPREPVSRVLRTMAAALKKHRNDPEVAALVQLTLDLQALVQTYRTMGTVIEERLQQADALAKEIETGT